MKSLATNQSHYVPQLLLKRWSKDGSSAWIWDAQIKTVELQALRDLCSEPADTAINTFWHREVENRAGDVLHRLCERKVQGPVDELRDFQPRTLDPLYTFVFSLRSRCPGVPPSWGGLTEGEHVALLQQSAAAERVLGYLRTRWKPALIQVASEQAMALTDYTVFPLKPVGGRGVLCLPIAPTRALLLVNRQIGTQPVAQMVASLDLRDVTHGTVGTLFILPPDARNWAASDEQAAIGDYIRKNIKEWRPQIWMWGQATDVSRPPPLPHTRHRTS